MNTPGHPWLPTDAAIRQRKTCKVLSDTDFPPPDTKTLVDELLQLAGMAPFHRACDESHRQSAETDGIEPWRFHAVDAADCRRLKRLIPQENAGKIPAMLAATDALILATWLPNPRADERPSMSSAEPAFEPTLANMEHIAAASAAVQNLLLAATARGVPNYWSSGGVLRSEEVLRLLKISIREILLGAIFLFPSQTRGAEVVGSKLREHRGAPSRWSRWVQLPAISEIEE